MIDRVGNCRIVEEIGSGGMAVVYKAVQEPLGRTVAVKALKTAMASDKQFSVSFNGKLEDDAIEGPVFRTDRPKQFVSYRLTKKADLPQD